jgi:hypothetical protein
MGHLKMYYTRNLDLIAKNTEYIIMSNKMGAMRVVYQNGFY